jgi:hypothetical protein
MDTTYINRDGHVACNYCGTVNPLTPCSVCSAHRAKLAKEEADQFMASAIFSTNLVKIERTVIGNFFQFTGTLTNGETICLRAKATRPYTVAAIHARSVVSKFDMPDVRGFVTFHQATPKPAGKWDNIIRTVPVTEKIEIGY